MVSPLRSILRAWRNARFPGSRQYWQDRYMRGGDSGDGSSGALAEFKADVMNAFVRQRSIRSVIEFGCGDGKQLALAEYPSYVGLDVSQRALLRCISLFAADRTKSFFLYDPACWVDHQRRFAADCAISLDVIYHLVEDRIYDRYLDHLFGAARHYVVIYSSDRADESLRLRSVKHVRHRNLTRDVLARYGNFSLIEEMRNRYPERSFASFFVYARNSPTAT